MGIIFFWLLLSLVLTVIFVLIYTEFPKETSKSEVLVLAAWIWLWPFLIPSYALWFAFRRCAAFFNLPWKRQL